MSVDGAEVKRVVVVVIFFVVVALVVVALVVVALVVVALVARFIHDILVCFQMCQSLQYIRTHRLVMCVLFFEFFAQRFATFVLLLWLWLWLWLWLLLWRLLLALKLLLLLLLQMLGPKLRVLRFQYPHALYHLLVGPVLHALVGALDPHLLLVEPLSQGR